METAHTQLSLYKCTYSPRHSLKDAWNSALHLIRVWYYLVYYFLCCSYPITPEWHARQKLYRYTYISTSSIGLVVMGSQIVSLLRHQEAGRAKIPCNSQWTIKSSASFNIKPWESQSPKEGPHQVMQQLLALKPYNHYSPDAVKMAHVAHAASCS